MIVIHVPKERILEDLRQGYIKIIDLFDISELKFTKKYDTK